MALSAFRFFVGVFLTLIAAPLAVWWTMSVHEPRCEWGEPFWDGDLPVGEGPVEGLILGSSRSGTDFDLERLAAGTGVAWQRIARHALVQSAVPPSYPAMAATSRARPGVGALVIEVSPVMFDQTTCSRPPIPHTPMRVAWLPISTELGIADRPSALAMTILPHRWLAGSGRRHDLIIHAKDPAHLARTLLDLRHLRRRPLSRWPGDPAPPLTPKNALNRREFLLGGKLDNFVPRLNRDCLATLARTVRAIDAGRTFLVDLPMRPMLRDTVELDYRREAAAAFRDLARSLPRTAFIDHVTMFDAAQDRNFHDFDHLNAAGSAAFTDEMATLLR